MTKATTTPTKKLFRQLNKTLTALVAVKVQEADIKQLVQDASDDFDYDKRIERAVDNYNFDDAIEEAVKDFDFDQAIEQSVDLDAKANTAIEEALSNADIDRKAEEAVEKAVSEKLPTMLETALFKLLEKPEVAEKLVKVLFDRAAS